MSPFGYLSIGAEDIECGDIRVVDIVNKLRDRLVDSLPVLVGNGELILLRKTCKAEFSFALFMVPVDISPGSCKLERRKASLPYATVGEIVKWRKHNVGVIQRGEGGGRWGGFYTMRRSGEVENAI